MAGKKEEISETRKSITDKLNNSGIKVNTEKRESKQEEYSGVLSSSKKVLKINV